MRSVPIREAEPDELGAVLALLARNDLPTEGLPVAVSLLVVAADETEVVACGALEVEGKDALLRSIAVTEHIRGAGLGRRIVSRLEERARDMGVQHVYLLTTTASGFFAKLGYEEIDREAVPSVVRSSSEFPSCSSIGATAMVRRLPVGVAMPSNPDSNA